ncbi:uncharacterized protein LOC103864113 [Brassica rapa]|uniref:F-box associated beta-propeller type 1 domain-containing protein n=1 Tax=Brassica campestris TaxID=3711 RepID=M4E9L5_BRACM|nr:uncharacterized protein LOC103864113 [Brassica rapa]
MNEDLILDIMSCCPATEISKFRLLNKACNKRSYEFHFINHHLHKTNSVLGYFIQDHKKHRRPGFVVFGGAEEEAPEKPRISLEFLPSRGVKIEACDAHHGIFLCVDDKFKGGRRIPDYIVCKPTTKQYRIIPNPKTRYFTIAIGLMVIQSNPFRYKIVRVSEPLPWERRKTSEGFYNLNCEVFDSDTYAWKRLNDLELPSGEFLRRSEKPESSYGFLHWLTGKNNVIQFCMQTETWSFFPLPEDVMSDGSSLDLVSYEGKLAVLCSNSNSRWYDLWVLDNSSGKSWANVKDVQVTDLEDKYAKPLWFLSNDVILVAGFARLGLYNTNSNKFQYLQKTTQECLPYYLPRDVCFPFYSNFESICLNEDQITLEDQRQNQR